jgi:hypothetical protein
MEDFKRAVLVVAREIGLVVFEIAAIRGRHVVFRVNTLNLGRIVEVLIGTEALVNDDRFSELRSSVPFHTGRTVPLRQQSVPPNKNPNRRTAVDSYSLPNIWRDIRSTGHPSGGPFCSRDFQRCFVQFSLVSLRQRVKVFQQCGDSDDAIVAIQPKDIQKIFEHPGLPAVLIELVMRLLYQTGVQSVELATIRLRTIDFGKREIRITSAKASADDENYIRAGHSLDYSAKPIELIIDFLEGRHSLAPTF